MWISCYDEIIAISSIIIDAISSITIDVVHLRWIDLPHVIKITRHPHRLYYTPFLPPTTVSPPCRICYKPVDTKYGKYSCNHNDFSYVAHSKCATQKKVWNGKELEWEPEEFDEIEDVTSFKKISDDLIKYFCHEHPLKLEKYDVARDRDKQCQACILHIDSRDFYNCFHCDIYLHEECANFPRKLNHALHRHTLLLDQDSPHDYKSLECLVRTRNFSGFRYKCSQDDCRDYTGRKFQVDIRCILVPDYFTHKCHQHPLFIPTNDAVIKCERCSCHYSCRFKNASLVLQCNQCEYVICYECATISEKLHNKYEEVPLSLCYGEDSDETYWCELCETKLNPREWFYTCNKPYITIHPGCVFGDSVYMKSGYIFQLFGFSFLQVVQL